MGNGCLNCIHPKASGGSLAAWKRKGVEPDLCTLHLFSKYEIMKCNQCDSHYIYNQKIFDDCIASHIPALLNWNASLDFYLKNEMIIEPIFENQIFHTLYSGIFQIRHETHQENAILILYDYPISSIHYHPLKPIQNNSEIEFIRLNTADEIQDQSINKYLVKHNRTMLHYVNF